MFGRNLRRLNTGWIQSILLGLAASIAAASPAVGDTANKPLVHVYSAADMGTDSAIWTTRQASDGILYFGGNELISFDGTRWQRTSTANGIALRSLDFGANGNLWAAAHNQLGWYAPQASGTWQYHSLVSKLPPGHTVLDDGWNVFAEGRGDRALFVYPEKILRWNGAEFKVWTFPGGRHLQGMKTGNTIYVHHAPTGLYAMDEAGPRLVIPAAVLGESMVLWVEQTPAGLLLANSQGLFTYRDAHLVPFAPQAAEYVKRHWLTCAVRLADGRIALGTLQGGIALVKADGDLDRLITENDGLPSYSILSLFEDREHGLWATSNSSVFRLTLNSDTTIVELPASLNSQPVVRVARNQNRILIASGNRIASMDPGTGTFRAMDARFGNITALLPADDGLLVAETGGITKISAETASSVFQIPQDAYAAKFSKRWPGKLLVADARSVFLVDPANGSSRIVVANLPDMVFFIAEDHAGRLWLGTATNGLLTATPNDVSPVEAVSASKEFGLPDTSGQARAVASDDGTVLAFTDSNGWVLGRNASRFIPIDDFPRWKVYSMSEVARDGSTWIVHPGGENRPAAVARVTIRGDRAQWEPHSVAGLEKVGTPTFILAEPDARGGTELWIAGTAGVVRNRVQDGPVAPTPRPPLLRSLARGADGQELRPIAAPLPYSTGKVVFQFAAPEFNLQPGLRLETMLDGVDRQWVPADDSNRREFTALRDGEYTFRVRAVAGTGTASQPTIRSFGISPPWWRTGIALIGALLALASAVYAAYRWRVRHLRLRNTELEQKVLERTEQLEKASAAKTQFIANMSHDIRNPLNGIVGLSLALEDTWLDAKQRELVSTLRECTSYLSTLVDDVLDFAAIEAGKVELRPGPFSPVELLRSIAAMFKVDAISSGAVLHVDSDTRLPGSYIGDAGRIQQVLVEFLTNAMKYAGGPIRLSVAIPFDAPEEIEFSVADNGPGISEEGCRILFNKFTRLTDSHSREITGSGLGLASCRLLAGLMSGSVGVESSPGNGARFFLRLPLDIFPMPGADAPIAQMVPPTPPDCTVLLVEDTNYNAMAAAAVLGKFGLVCERATTGAEALRMFAEKRYNLVLLDRNLPDMDGTEVARRMRVQETEGPRAILLAVTAYCTTEDRTLCLNAGMDAFVGKPLTPQKLRRVLTAAGRRHLAAASMHIAPQAEAEKIDVSLLEYISDGTDEGLNRQIEIFLVALGESGRKVDHAAKQRDFKAMTYAAHCVLSHARLVGSAPLSSAATDLHSAAMCRDIDAFHRLTQRVRHEIESLTATVRNHSGEERPA